MANHLEQLISEWLEFQGFIVRKNVKVGKLDRGGYAGEIDIAAYHPVNGILLHVEPSLDALPLDKKDQRFQNKFNIGKQYVVAEVFPWLDPAPPLTQWAVVWAANTNRLTLGGGELIPVWDLYTMIAEHFERTNRPITRAIPENFPLLRTLHQTYHWVCKRGSSAKSLPEACLRFQSAMDRVNQPQGELPPA